ncbi:N-acetyltransferase [Echinicola pacifica]|uniref:N-acetyltransferase n=1 Tax=Echinicola pacifica TaxID=346377 RepID=A0A918ULD9_9BACT|nr:GNAT family protein [Echinicola pacifica]GGZ18369.1 N-acetyltransferase [Echinicola pacifica]
MKIQGENSIALVSWGQDHFHKLYPLANNIRISQNLKDSFPHPYTLHDARAWIEHNIKFTPSQNFAIEMDGKLVGAIGGVIGKEELRTNMEIGFWLGEAYWGQGIATEALKLFVPYIFQRFPIHRVYAQVYENNLASMRVLEKSGFVEEAILKFGYIKNDQIGDLFQYVRLRDND